MWNLLVGIGNISLMNGTGVTGRFFKNETTMNTTGYQNSTSTIIPSLLYLRTRFSVMLVTTFILFASAVVGTLGNLLVILTIALVRSLRTCGNMFILNLALADLVITIFIDPFNAMGALSGETMYDMGENMLCKMIGSVCAPVCMSSMWNMCFISLNRYVLICYPHLYHRIFTRTYTFLICLLIWVLCHVLGVPNHLGWGRITFETQFYLCTFDVFETYSYAVFYVAMGVMVPLVGVLFGYAGIFYKVRSVKLQMRQYRHQQSVVPNIAIVKEKTANQNDFTQDDVRLAKTLFMAFVVFSVCWGPFGLLVLIGKSMPKWTYVAAILMAHGNSAMNPIVYGLFNEKFREGYGRVTKCNLRGRSVANSVANPSRRNELSIQRHSAPASSPVKTSSNNFTEKH